MAFVQEFPQTVYCMAIRSSAACLQFNSQPPLACHNCYAPPLHQTLHHQALPNRKSSWHHWHPMEFLVPSPHHQGGCAKWKAGFEVSLVCIPKHCVHIKITTHMLSHQKQPQCFPVFYQHCARGSHCHQWHTTGCLKETYSGYSLSAHWDKSLLSD